MSATILTRLSEAYRKLRNTFRYALGNIHDFNPATDSVAGCELREIDQWILVRTEELVLKCRGWYDEFAFHKVYRAVYDFAAIELSSVYFDVLKDRLYTSATKSQARRSAQTALHRVSMALVRLLAPMLSFTMEEVWGQPGQAGSVHTAYFPDAAELTMGIPADARKRVENWSRLIPPLNPSLNRTNRLNPGSGLTSMTSQYIANTLPFKPGVRSCLVGLSRGTAANFPTTRPCEGGCHPTFFQAGRLASELNTHVPIPVS